MRGQGRREGQDAAKRRFQAKVREQLEEKQRALRDGKPFDEATLLGKRGFPYGQVKQKLTQYTPPLVTVAAKGTVEDVKKCVERRNDVNMTDAQGYTATLHAAIHGHIRVTKVLVEQANADINIRAKDKNTALHAAAAGGHVSLVTYLLRNKADIHAQNSEGWTPLNLAAQNGHREVVSLLLAEGADPDVPANEQWNAMMSAALNGHTEVIRMLLEKGADSTMKSESGWTPMLLAARNSHINSCDLLFRQRSVDIDDANYLGETAVLLGAKGGHINLVDWLVKKEANLDKPNEDGWTPLLFAAKAGYTGVCRVLVNGKVSVNKQNTKGWTAFATACYYGKIEVATVLARAGANLTLASDGGWTPLMYASKAGSHQMVHTLLQKLKVTNVDDQNGKGWTALMVAAKNGSAKIMKLLIDHGACVDMRNFAGASALTIALVEANLPIVKQLVQAGADLDSPPHAEAGLRISGFVESPSIAAAKGGQLTVVRYLYELGVDMTAGDANGWTPLMEACRGGHGPIVAFLRDMGSDILSQSATGWTARRAAEENRHQQVVEVLLAQRNMSNPYMVGPRVHQEGRQRLEQYRREKEQRASRFIDVATTTNQGGACPKNAWGPLPGAASRGAHPGDSGGGPNSGKGPAECGDDDDDMLEIAAPSLGSIGGSRKASGERRLGGSLDSSSDGYEAVDDVGAVRRAGGVGSAGLMGQQQQQQRQADVPGMQSAAVGCGLPVGVNPQADGWSIPDLVGLVQHHVDSDAAVKLLRTMIQEKKAFVEQQKHQIKTLKQRIAHESGGGGGGGGVPAGGDRGGGVPLSMPVGQPFLPPYSSLMMMSKGWGEPPAPVSNFFRMSDSGGADDSVHIPYANMNGESRQWH